VPQVTPAALRAQIASGDIGPLYLLSGDDEVEKAALAEEITATTDEGLRAFNVERLYGGDTTVEELIGAASQLPMMAPRRVIVVLDAERLLAPKKESKAAEEAQARLEHLLGHPPPHATMVFVCASILDERRRVFKAIAEHGAVVKVGDITDPGAAARWVSAAAKREGMSLAPAAVQAFVGRTGHEIGRLRAGVERLRLFTLGTDTVSVEDVREAVPVAPNAPENWGIANAIEAGDLRRALRQLALALDSGASEFYLLGQLRVAAGKLPGPRVQSGIDAVFRTDLALKSSGGKARLLLERLVVELCPGEGRGAAGRRHAR